MRYSSNYKGALSSKIAEEEVPCPSLTSVIKIIVYYTKHKTFPSENASDRFREGNGEE